MASINCLEDIALYLYHYFEKAKGPFLSISDLPHHEATKKLIEIQKVNPNLVNPKIDWFLSERHRMEDTVRRLFIDKGGKPMRKYPVYMTVGEIKSMSTWYSDPAFIKIGISEFDLDTVSFTYGDMFPVFNPDLDDGMEYRNNVYKYNEILKIIEKYGYPQNIEYNLREGIFPVGAPMNHFLKYVEAHIWSEEVISRYRNEWLMKNAEVFNDN
ncbi:MAG TPA: hypothetical protein VHT96_09965 [Clostridia bacterium]|nr:hypothetical protein [Clostridia bacterium]